MLILILILLFVLLTPAVEDVNLALTALNVDKVYGLLGAERGGASQDEDQQLTNHEASTTSTSSSVPASANPTPTSTATTAATFAITEHHNKIDLGTTVCWQEEHTFINIRITWPVARLHVLFFFTNNS